MLNFLSYMFFFLLGFCSLCVVLFQNTFFALLFLILSFLLTSILLFFFECEFLSLILIIIYVGAVAVLLLFVLIMLETKLKSFSQDVVRYFPFGVFINGIFFFEFVSFINQTFTNNLFFFTNSKEFVKFNSYLNWYDILDSVTELEVYGHLLYTQFVLQVLIVGLILFLALAGVIFLTSKPVYFNIQNQTSFCQLSRSYLDQNPSQLIL